MSTRSPWWDKRVHEDRRGLLLARNRIRDAVRAYFGDQGFTEVECGILQVSPGNEAHLHAFATTRTAPDGTNDTLYMHTSPEFAAKKLLAAGEEKIFTLGPVFRNRERGALHSPEFFMLEWYRVGEDYNAVIADAVALARLAAKAAGTKIFRFRGREANVSDAPERLSVVDVFRRYADVDLLASLEDRDSLARQAQNSGITTAPDDTWSDIFSRILVARIEPHLGTDRLTVLDLYPVMEAALARPAPDPRFAERFELYACGVELANGFGELTNSSEQRRRLNAEMDEKQRVHGERYPLDEDFLAALKSMPEASGVALGFDRLVMLATGAERISQVMWTQMP